ncbi:fimbria/pilus periplasmic chaperone [Serratia marcescens]|uniref:fimbria/pilus periplasmic chaperone n=1 Tax=Serratia marcescens TaxID=615 RepID=UPI0024C4ADD4|nr:fimbria/pilus periplasmic chaperone [Serratia marcescens]MDK1711725.1 fimbria/pilus periplasmic chaperone [Serratia marcescens]
MKRAMAHTVRSTVYLLSVIAAGQVMAQNLKQTVESYSVALGATRVIYTPESGASDVSVTNSNDYPMLVQSLVYAEDRKSAAPFVVTPPLFRLDGHQTSRVRVIQTGGGMPADKETLQWLCVTGIPPENDDAWAKNKEGSVAVPKSATLDVKIKFSRCIKLLVRPSAIKSTPQDAAEGLVWQREGALLKVSNPSPYYVNLKTLSVGGKAIVQPGYLPPSGSHTYPLPAGAQGAVQWSYITDLGGDSRTFQALLK